MYITRDHKGSHQFSINNLDHFDVVPVTIVGLLRRYEHVLISVVIPRKLEEHRLHFRPVHLVQVHVQLVQGPVLFNDVMRITVVLTVLETCCIFALPIKPAYRVYHQVWTELL